MFGSGDEPIVFLTINAFIAGMFAVGLAIGVVLAVGGLLIIQVRLSLCIGSHLTGQTQHIAYTDV